MILSKEERLEICEKAEAAMHVDLNLSWRESLITETITAILAKLASAELPEPFGLFCGVRHDPPKTKEFWGILNEGADNGSKCNLYSADQLTAWGNTRYAQGAAAQLAQEPTFFYRPTCNGEMYEGPHHARSVGGRMLREEKPTEWVELYTRSASK